jgi:hypothetical protein
MSAQTNVAFNQLTGQMTVSTSGAKDWKAHPKRFVETTIQSLASAQTLPLVEETADFVRTIWPQTNQEELLGQAAPDDENFARHRTANARGDSMTYVRPFTSEHYPLFDRMIRAK